jgi:tRNA (cytidine/uridine-2'-O-)-methyltransferase
MLIALFQPDIPQNLGAALRLGACLGVGVDVIEPCGFPLSDRAIARSAMDYGALAQVTRHSGWTEFRLRRPNRLVLFTTKSAQPFHEFSFAENDVLLFGRESAGVPDEIHDAADARLMIPLAPGARSLNVVNAAAMALGEALRQTKGFPSPMATG